MNYQQIDNPEVFVTGTTPPGSSAEDSLIYRALLTQTGTAAPEVIVLENTLGGDVVWTRADVGYYKGTLAGAFPLDTTFPIIGQIEQTAMIILYPSTPPNEMGITTSLLLTGALADGILYRTPVEIRVFS